MSLIKVNALTNLAGTQQGNVADIVQGYAKAWVNFNGTGVVAIRASYNVASITDNGVGDFTINFTVALVDGGYSTVLACDSAAPLINVNTATAPSASAVRISTKGTGGAAVDVTHNNVAVFR